MRCRAAGPVCDPEAVNAGLLTEEPADLVLVETLLAWMQKTKADFTNTFADLAPERPKRGEEPFDPEFQAWHESWVDRLGRQSQSAAESTRLRQSSNPAFIPRNHRVEAALAAAEQGDISEMERLLDVLSAPYDHAREANEYRLPDPRGGAGYETFCGT